MQEPLIEVHISPALAHLTGGAETIRINAGTVKSGLKEIASRYPDFQKTLLDGRGQPHSWVDIYLNQELIKGNNINQTLSEGDRIEVLVVLYGG